MGKYVNPKTRAFAAIIQDGMYVDKTGLISYMNGVLGNPRKNLVCSTRPRRFGKSYAVQMLTAYYSRGCDSRSLFDGLQISADPSFPKYLNSCDVITWDCISFFGPRNDDLDFVSRLNRALCDDLRTEFPEAAEDPSDYFPDLLLNVCIKTDRRFLFIIDEWDAIYRERAGDEETQRRYIEFLRNLFKGNRVADTVCGAYMTGILPITKYGTQSALNDFKEFTMVEPGALSEFIGFTASEVMRLCSEHGLDYADIVHWYGGYLLNGGDHVFCPYSIMEAIINQKTGCYWTQTETYTSLKRYIDLNYDGLAHAIILMLAGESLVIDTLTLRNDITSIKSKDDVLILLVHLGYLGYDSNLNSVSIPNEELRQEFIRAITNTENPELIKKLKIAERILETTISQDAVEMASLIEELHKA